MIVKCANDAADVRLAVAIRSITRFANRSSRRRPQRVRVWHLDDGVVVSTFRREGVRFDPYLSPFAPSPDVRRVVQSFGAELRRRLSPAGCFYAGIAVGLTLGGERLPTRKIRPYERYLLAVAMVARGWSFVSLRTPKNKPALFWRPGHAGIRILSSFLYKLAGFVTCRRANVLV